MTTHIEGSPANVENNALTHFSARRRVGLIALVVLLVLSGAGLAAAYWTSTGNGTASATVGTLSAPGSTTAAATPGSSTVSVSWTASTVSTGLAPDGYYVQRVPNTGGGTAAACTTTATALTTALSCNDTTVPSGSYHYLVTAVYRSWTAGGGNSNDVTVTAASKLAFTAQPSSAVAGTSIGSVKVTVEDSSGNPVAVSGTPVTVALGNNPAGGVLSGTPTANTDATGVATFSDLSINKAGNGYTLSAASTGLTGTASTSFNITAATASQLSFSQQPTNTGAGASITPAVAVQILDQYGNLTTSTAAVTLAIGNNNPPVGSVLSGTNPRAAVSGVATFNDLSINKPGNGYSLAASSPNLTGSSSGAFKITVGPASKLVITSTPLSGQATNTATLGAVTVQLQDLGGNLVTATSATTVNLASNTAGTAIFASTTGGAAVSSVTIPSGSSSVIFYYGDTKAGSPVITASAASMSSATQTETVTAAAASKLAYSQQPTTTVAGASIPQVTVQVLDTYGNLTSSTAGITLAIATNPGSGALSGTKTKAAVAGTASFSDLSIDKIGTGYTLIAAANTFTSATSNTFNINPATGSKLVIISTAVSGQASSSATVGPITVQLQDSFGNPVTTGVAVTLASNSTGTKVFAATSGGTPTTTITIAAGSSTATFFYGDTTPGGATLTVSSPSLLSGSQTETILAAPASALVFTSSALSGAASSTATLGPITVQELDSFGNVATAPAGGTTVTLTSSSTGTKLFAATLGGTSTTTVIIPAGSSSVAFYYGDTRVGNPTITASSGSLGSSSQIETINAATANKLAFGQQPTTTVAGASITPAVTVQVVDQFGNLTGSTATVTLAIGTNPGGGTLSGSTSQTAISGVATFSGLSINKVGAAYTLTGASTGLTGATSNSFPVTAAIASKLAFSTAPLSGAASSSASLGPITVQEQDSFGNPAPAPAGGTTVNLASSSTGTATFAGTANGTPSITSLIIPAGSSNASFYYGDTKAGSPTITLSGALTGAAQTQTITAAAANSLAFGQQPTSTVAGASITPAVMVQIFDQFGNLTASTASVTLSIGTNPSSGTLSGTQTQTASAGVASFSNLSINKVGTGYTLSAAGAGAPTTTSGTFNISAGAASRLAFTTAAVSGTASATRLGPITVQEQDSSGNPVAAPAGGTTVNVASTSPSATIFPSATGGSPVTSVTIAAGSTDASVYYSDTKAGNPLVTASSPSFTSATQTETISAAAPAKLGIGQQPTTTSAGVSISPAITVQIVDQYGNLTTSTAGVTLAIGANPSSGTLAGTTTQSAISGVATFNDLSINKVGTGYTLSTTSGTLSGATSGTFNITPGAAAKLVFAQQPTNTAAGTSISPAVTVQILDQFNNLTTSTASVTLAIGTGSPSPSSLSGTVTQTASSGVATFSDLSIKKAGTGYTLAASGGTSLTSSTSTAFNITTGPASNLAWTSTPAIAGCTGPTGVPFTPVYTSCSNNTAFTSTLSLTDSSGNPVVNPGTAITVSMTLSGSGGGSVSAPSVAIQPGASSSASITFTSGTGSFNNLLTAKTTTTPSYASATVTLSK